VQEIKYGQSQDPTAPPCATRRSRPSTPARLSRRLVRHLLRHRRHPHARRARRPRYIFQKMETFDRNSAADSAITSPPVRWPRWASWLGTGAERSPNTSPAARRRFSSRKTARSAWNASTACPDTRAAEHRAGRGDPLEDGREFYVTDAGERSKLAAELKGVESCVRREDERRDQGQDRAPFKDIIRDEVNALAGIRRQGQDDSTASSPRCPLPTPLCRPIYRSIETKTPGAARHLLHLRSATFAKAGGECVQVSGDHDALPHGARDRGLERRADDRAEFSRLLPDTPQKYLACTTTWTRPSSREAALRNHLMVRRNYEGAGLRRRRLRRCGEKKRPARPGAS